MASWPTGRLEDLVTLQRGYDIAKREFQNGPYPVISSSGVIGRHAHHKSGGPGVLVGRKGTLGTVHYCSTPYFPHSTALWSRDFHGNHPRFVYYFLQTIRLERFDSGAANPTLNRNHIHSLPIRIPPRETQAKIAAALAAYDELIDNNLRRIEILEEMARLQFQPVTKAPARTSDNSFGNIADEVRVGVAPASVDAAVPYVGLEHIPRKSIALLDFGNVASVTSRKWAFRKGDILFGKLRPYFHKVVSAPFDGICSTDAIVIRPKSGFEVLALLTASSDEFVAHATSTAGGTDRPRANWSDLASFELYIPDEEAIRALTSGVQPMVHLMNNLIAQNQNLRAARDLLLPKLISGEIDVSELDIDTSWLAA